MKTNERTIISEIKYFLLRKQKNDDTGPFLIKLDKENKCSGDESHLVQCKPSNLWEHDYECSYAEDVCSSDL